MQRHARFFFTALAAVVLIGILDSKIGNLPPLGKFFSPCQGFWQNGLHERRAPQQFSSKAISGKVEIVWDDRAVPHIFADNDLDLYFAQGYVTAYHRLWQMDFQTYAAAGRLSEIFGRRTYDFDVRQRRLGMLTAAQTAAARFIADPQSKEICAAYTAGVNAYIDSLAAKDYPLEYKILDYRPEPWTPLKSALLLKYMAWRLSGLNHDLQMTRNLKKIGREAFDQLFPTHPADIEPVIPLGTPWNFTPVTLDKPEQLFVTEQELEPPEPTPQELRNKEGSNNWAVAGSKTASGYPLLANDPHLNLSLPSVWYEMQLVSPTVNVYGVTLPGAPCVIVGFNDKIAWGVTNGTDDVADWYELECDKDYTAYRHGGEWKKMRLVKEEITVRDEGTLIEQVLYTHHGPVPAMPEDRRWRGRMPMLAAFRWAGHEPSNELFAFHELNRAHDYEGYERAISHYSCPAQNFVFADASGDIAMWHNGKLPARWPQQGRFICDGRDPRYDWQAWIPQPQNPHVKNPASGFVSSANQHATDASYPYFLNAVYESYRNVRINERLSAMHNVTPDDFRSLLTDAKDLHAASVLPSLLPLVDIGKIKHPAAAEALRLLGEWDFSRDAGKVAPAIFSEWWKWLYRAIWEDDFGEPPFALYPTRRRTVELIVYEPAGKWFDDKRTAEVESLRDLAQQSFVKAVSRLDKKYGRLTHCTWGRYQNTHIDHLARIPGLGRDSLYVSGGASCINATTEETGPSWRMVVALGPQVKAWGVYPGGQSGNPGSRHYDNFIETWRRGELAELLYLRSPNEKNPRLSGCWSLTGEKP